MRRSDHPSRPKAMTCCFFSSFKTLLTSTEGIALASTQRPECWLIVGRFSGDYAWPVLGDHRGISTLPAPLLLGNIALIDGSHAPRAGDFRNWTHDVYPSLRAIRYATTETRFRDCPKKFAPVAAHILLSWLCKRHDVGNSVLRGIVKMFRKARAPPSPKRGAAAIRQGSVALAKLFEPLTAIRPLMKSLANHAGGHLV